MSRNRLTDSQAGFAAYNPNGLYEPIDPSQFANVTNMRVVRNVEIAKRTGFKVSGTLAGAGVYFLSAFSPADGALTGTPHLVWCEPSDNKVRWATFSRITGLLTTTTIASPTGVAIGPTAHFRDGTSEALYICAGTGKHLSKWNGAALTGGVTTSDPTNITYIWVANQRLFGVAPGNPQTLYWSGLNNGDTLGDVANGGGSATIRTFGGGLLQWGFQLGPTNYLIHSRGISAFTGRTFDDIAIQAGTEGVTPDVQIMYCNPQQGKPFAVINGIAYLVTQTGLVLLRANGTVEPYDQPDQPDPILSRIRTSYQVQCNGCMEHTRKHELWIWLSVLDANGGTGRTEVLIYNTALNRFTGQATITPSASSLANMAMVQGWSTDYPNPTPQPFITYYPAEIEAFDFADPNLNVYQDRSVNFTSSVQCRRLYTPQPQSTKSWRQAFVQMGLGGASGNTLGSATGASVTYADPVAGSVSDGTPLLAGMTNNVQLSGQGQYVDVTITDGGNSSTDWSVQRVDASGFDMGLRGN
jgi:hypothetical protein